MTEDFTQDELQQLAALAAATDDLRPAASFVDAMMAAVDAEQPPEDVGQRTSIAERRSRTAAVALIVASVAAAASWVMSVQSESAYDADVMATIDVVEEIE